jgi:DNA-binding PadR family transcriptional regulator
MSVKHGLLAILALGPCYGYQLRAEFDRRTGSTWPLNVGQIYNTLERLERDGLVDREAVDAEGHVYWRITDTGSAAVQEWLTAPVRRPEGTRDELTIKLSMAATLPGADIDAVVRGQRAISAARRRELEDASYPGDPDSPEAFAWALVTDAQLAAVDAEVRWLDRVSARLAQHPRHAMALALSADRPRRGRPASTPG